MPTKRRKAWWHLLRGPRGHRGLPGPPGISEIINSSPPQIDVAKTLQGYVPLADFANLVGRVADLERKLGGSQK